MDKIKLKLDSLKNIDEISTFANKIVLEYPTFKLVPFQKDLLKIKKRLGYVLTEFDAAVYLSYECDNDHHTIIQHKDLEEIEYITDYKKRKKDISNPEGTKQRIICNNEEQTIYDFNANLLVKYININGQGHQKIRDIILLDNNYFIGIDFLKINGEEKSMYYIFPKDNIKKTKEISLEDYKNLVATYNIKSKNMYLKSEAFSIKNPTIDKEIDDNTFQI